jgi:hypothetical protein
MMDPGAVDIVALVNRGHKKVSLKPEPKIACLLLSYTDDLHVRLVSLSQFTLKIRAATKVPQKQEKLNAKYVIKEEI